MNRNFMLTFLPLLIVGTMGFLVYAMTRPLVYHIVVVDDGYVPMQYGIQQCDIFSCTLTGYRFSTLEEIRDTFPYFSKHKPKIVSVVE